MLMLEPQTAFSNKSIISKRYEKGSLIVTTNRELKEGFP
jgi:hypothetical protein